MIEALFQVADAGFDGSGHVRDRRGRWFIALAAGVSVLAGTCGALGAKNDSLEGKVAAAIDKARMGSARIGISILDCQTGLELVSVLPPGTGKGAGDAGFVPASNLKLLTTATAAMILGPDYEFRTEAFCNHGLMIVHGVGDPAVADPDLLSKMHLTLEEFLDRLIDSAKRTGVCNLHEVVIDDRVFDREYVHPDWPAEQLNRAYCAQVSGLNFYANILNVYVAPGARANDPAIARSEPSGPWLRVQSLAKTITAKGEGQTEVWLERDKEPFSFRLHGSVRVAPDAPIQVTVNEPGLFFGRVLGDRLRAAGLTTGGLMPSVRLCSMDEQLDESGMSVAVIRTPIGLVLERCNVDSDNLYAECLLKAAGNKLTGQPGSWSNGTSAVRMQMKELIGGEIASQLVMADGCGLSKNNHVSPGMLTRWLRAVAARPTVGDMFVRSLALAGEEGTLRKRFKGAKLKNEVRAKSGYIAKVRTLSGFVTNPTTGRRIAFSVLVNDLPPGSDQLAKELHENVVEAVDEWLAENARAMPPALPVEPVGSGH